MPGFFLPAAAQLGSMLSTMGTYPKNIIRTSDITVLYSLFDQEEAGLFKDFLKPKMTLQSIY